MNFKQRLKLYLIGVFFGLIVVYFSLIKNRDRNIGEWLPENRVLAQLDSVPLIYSPELGKCIECLSLDEKEIKKIISSSDVDFNKSITLDKEHPVYFIDGKLNSGQKISFLIESSAKKSTLKKVTTDIALKNCNCS